MSDQFKVSHAQRGEIEPKEKDPFEPIREYNLLDGIMDMIDVILDEYYDYYMQDEE